MNELKKTNEDWDCRAISDNFLNKLKEGNLRPFVELVKRHQKLEEPRLALCFRGNDSNGEKVDIYYNTHRMFRLSSRTLYVNSDYIKKCPDAEREEIINYLAQHNFKKISSGWSKTIDERLLANLEELYKKLVKVFDCYFKNSKNKREKERQQQLFHFMNEQENGYFTYDLEFAQKHLSKAERKNAEEDGESNRTDMLAVKFCKSKPIALAFIEVKSDEGACEGTSGVEAHIKDMLRYPKKPETLRARYDEACLIMFQYHELGLIDLQIDFNNEKCRKEYEEQYRALYEQSLEKVLVFTDTAVDWLNNDKGQKVVNQVRIIQEEEIELPISETEKETIIWVVFDKK